MNAPNFSAVLRDIRAEEFDEREKSRIEDLLATEAQVLANALHCEDLLNQRAARALPRRFSGEPITGWGPLSTSFQQSEPEMTPAEIAAENHQDWLETRAKEERHARGV